MFWSTQVKIPRVYSRAMLRVWLNSALLLLTLLLLTLLLLTVQCVPPNDVNHFVKEKYAPFGPNMCEELCKDEVDRFIYSLYDLTCWRIPKHDYRLVEDPATDVTAACTNGNMRNSEITSMAKVGKSESCYLTYLDSKKNGLSFLGLHNETLLTEDYNYSCALHQACKEGNLCMIQYILTRKLVDINVKCKQGRTPVMTAARNGRVSVFSYLVRQGCNLSVMDDKNNTILHMACMCGNAYIVRKLTDSDKHNIEKKGDNGMTPVMIAALFGHREIYNILVKKHCNLTITDIYQNNILHVACRGGHVEFVNYLLSLGTFNIDRKGQFGSTPVLIAAFSGYIEVVKLLVSKGCDMQKARDIENNTILHVACIGGHKDIVKYIIDNEICHIESRDYRGRTPVMLAIEAGHKDVVDILISGGCNLKALDYCDGDILHAGCRGGHIKLVEFILSLDHINMEKRARYSQTPLLIAAKYGHIDVFKLLVKKGCDLTVVDKFQNNILHTACVGGEVDMAKYILKHNLASIEGKNTYGRTPFMTAVEYNHTRVVEFLESQGCNVKAVDDTGNNILHLACFRGFAGMVENILSRHFVSKESKTQSGYTPLMIASRWGSKRLVELLVQKGCNVKSVTNNGNTILHLACLSGKVDTVKYLLKIKAVNRNVRNKHGKTPVQFAKIKGHLRIVKLFK